MEQTIHAKLSIALAIIFLTAGIAAACDTSIVYPYGESSAIKGTATGCFHYQKLSVNGHSRWALVAPDGNMFFPVMAALMDINSSGVLSAPEFNNYDAVWLQPGGGANPIYDLTNAAWDLQHDMVVAPGHAGTFEAAGDVMWIGSSKWQPEYPYIQVKQFATGLTLEYDYVATDGIPTALANAGRAAGQIWYANTLNSAGSYAFDVGGRSRGFDLTTGFYSAAGSALADEITLWQANVVCPGSPVGQGPSCTWPRNFTSQAFPTGYGTPPDSTPRYWIRVVASTTPTQAPIVAHLHEGGTMPERILARYSGTVQTPYLKFFNDMLPRIAAYGFSALDYYSYKYHQLQQGKMTGDGGVALNANATWPDVWQAPLGGVMGAGSCGTGSGKYCIYGQPYAIHNVFDDLGDKKNIYYGSYIFDQADPFDPSYERSVKAAILNTTNTNNGPIDNTRLLYLIKTDADQWACFNNPAHLPRCGVMVLISNPYQPTGWSADFGSALSPTNYSLQPVLIAKLSLASWLANQLGYAGSVFSWQSGYMGDANAAASLAALNGRWGTHYTTWDTSSGSVVSGTNAWGTGTGFVDENGSHIISAKVSVAAPDATATGSLTGANPTYCDSGVSGTATWVNSGTNTQNLAVECDLHAFDVYMAYTQAWKEKAGLEDALPTNRPIYAESMYNPEPYFAAVIDPYVDLWWMNPNWNDTTKQGDYTASPGAVAFMAAVFARLNHPVVLASYASAMNDGEGGGQNGTVTSVSYNASTRLTTIVETGVRYKSLAQNNLRFQTSGGADLATCPQAQPRPTSISWDEPNGTVTWTLSGDYSSCLAAGDLVHSWEGVPAYDFDFLTYQAAAANDKSRFNAYLNLPGSDGSTRLVAGLSFWDWFAEAEYAAGSSTSGYSFFDKQFNLLDGIQNVETVTTNSMGWPQGGEDDNPANPGNPLWGNRLAGVNELGPYLAAVVGELK